MSLWSYLPRKEQARLADMFNAAFRGSEPMEDGTEEPTVTSCTCGAWNNIEKALERIREQSIYTRLILILSHMDFRDGEKHNDAHLPFDLCEIPAEILDLATKHTPKEREWRVRDVLKSPMGGGYGDHDWIIVAIESSGNFPIKVVQFDTTKADGLYPQHKNPNWRNLTIEAEQSGEK
ncbi:hypothetical protein LCGC14_0679840 [marine sediment metagenome]|uniref:Uncharacterized protein n=1 Tax=marine sediment metagenome TaxID=412755 RepID=A0A0F9T9Z0_9ZZZZ